MVSQIREAVVALLEIVGISTAGYYGYKVYKLASKNKLMLACYGLWYLFGFLAILCGLLSYAILGLLKEDYNHIGNLVLRRHYSFAWMTGLAYIGLVCYDWYIYSGSAYAFLQLLAIIFPIALRFMHGAPAMELSQIATVMGLLSHFYISYYAQNAFGMATALNMGLFALAASVPTYFTREVLELALACGCCTIYLCAEQVVKNPKHLSHIPGVY